VLRFIFPKKASGRIFRGVDGVSTVLSEKENGIRDGVCQVRREYVRSGEDRTIAIDYNTAQKHVLLFRT